VSYGNLGTRPDLRPLFGSLSREENDCFLDRLIAIDDRLTQLARDASDYVGVPYKPCCLGLFVRRDDADVAGGPSGAAGDIWFEVGFTDVAQSRRAVAPPWTIESRLIVFCSDGPEPRHDSNTHDLACFIETADTPATVLDVLEAHVSAMAAEIRRHEPRKFTQTPHAQLP
jgi:hypothetical protein